MCPQYIQNNQFQKTVSNGLRGGRGRGEGGEGEEEGGGGGRGMTGVSAVHTKQPVSENSFKRAQC